MTKRKRRKRAASAVRELQLDELQGIVERAKTAPLSDADYATLKAVVETLAFLTEELSAKGASIERLRRLLFGPSSEKTHQVFGDASATANAAEAPGGAEAAGTRAAAKPKAPGHGRHAAAAYRGAEKIPVPHASVGRGDHCPECRKGKVYALPEPAALVRVRGMAPLAATVYECARLRCNLCGEVFTADPPPGVGREKYDETVAAMIGLLKYGTGLPFNRIEKLQQGFGIPLPAATQWEIVERAAERIAPAHEKLIQEAAQGDVLYNDDTGATILELDRPEESEEPTSSEAENPERTGVFTSGIVSTTRDGHHIGLFFTGPKHAGENLTDVLRQRAAELEPPIQMCDALSRNLPAELQTIVAHCLAHARRRFVDVANDFPDECRYLLETLGEVYHRDALAHERALSPEERLRFHQTESAPLMTQLEDWLRTQIEEHKVEPNSGLGEAIGYMRKHWAELTLFLRVPGAPLDNNLCERALKKAILHRKNALFFKTRNGARVGDCFMSLIHTAELNNAQPFDYLVALQRHHQDVAAQPGDWMPWNYRDTLARRAPGPDPPT